MGWEPDGALINSTLAFALTSIAVYSITKGVDLPQPLAQHLSAIPVQYTRFNGNQGRVLQNMVDSAVQRHANRTVQCPVFLAQEFGRMDFQPHYIKPSVKLYQQRSVMSPLLQMPQNIENCVIRLMRPDKSCSLQLSCCLPVWSNTHCVKALGR